MSLIRFLIVVVLLSASNALAQEADTTNYFPLEVGNSWTYYGRLDPPDSPPIIYVGKPLTITDTVMVNDTLYTVAPHPNGFADRLRDDGEGRIWARFEGKDVLLYDFTLTEGETYVFDRGNPGELFEVSITRHLVIDTIAGHFEKCVRLFFDTEALDGDFTYWFAPGVGMVQSYDGMGEGSYLYEAVVDGKVISSTEDDYPTSRRENDAYAYPNPFSSATTVILPVKAAPAPMALVYDILGRKVASLTADRCELGHCVYPWDGSGLPMGLYYVAAAGGRGLGVVHR